MERAVVIRGDIWTGDPTTPRAASVLVARGKILAVDPVDPPAAARVVEVEGLVLPGLVDAHMHVFWVGEQMYRYVDVGWCRSVGEVLEVVRAKGRERDGWVLGRGLDESRLVEKRLPTGEELEGALPGRAVGLSRVCGHVGVMSPGAEGALSAEVRGRSSGEGKYEEGAWWGALGAVPKLSNDELAECAVLALSHARGRGFVGVGTMVEEMRQVGVLLRLWREGRLPVRVAAHVPGESLINGEDAKARREAESANELLGGGTFATGFGDDWFRIGAAKFFADGTLGARTAWMKEDYSDRAGERGMCLISPGAMRDKFAAARAFGFQVAVHAIGDAAVEAVVGALAAMPRGAVGDRVEHVSLADDGVIGAMEAAGIWGVVQPQFVGSDTWMVERVGARATGAYRFGAMRRAGVRLALSSDAPVEEMSPGATLAAAIGGNAWNQDGSIPPAAALGAYTAGAREVSGLGGGVIRVGEAADFSVASVDVERAGSGELRRMSVRACVGGVWSSNSGADVKLT